MKKPALTSQLLEKLTLWCFDTTHADPPDILSSIVEHSDVVVFVLGTNQHLILPPHEQQARYGIHLLRWHFRQLSRGEALFLLKRFEETHPAQVPAIIAWTSQSP